MERQFADTDLVFWLCTLEVGLSKAKRCSGLLSETQRKTVPGVTSGRFSFKFQKIPYLRRENLINLVISHVVSNASFISLDCLSVIRDLFTRLNLSFEKLRGQCCDGASAMSSVAKQIHNIEPRAVFTHCYGHSLNLAASDALVRADASMEGTLYKPRNSSGLLLPGE